MCTLNTCAVIRIQISKLSCLEKLLPVSCKLQSLKHNAVWRFSVNLVYSMPIPYCDEAHTTCGMCLELSLSPMQSLISLDSFRKPPLRFPYILTMTERRVGACEHDYSLSTQCESESYWPMITAKKLSQSNFLLQACLAYVSTMALCYTQSAITTSQATVEIVFADSCRTWDLRSKNGLKWSPSIQFNKISREHAPRTLCILLAVCRLWPHHIEIACYSPVMCLVGNGYHKVHSYW